MPDHSALTKVFGAGSGSYWCGKNQGFHRSDHEHRRILISREPKVFDVELGNEPQTLTYFSFTHFLDEILYNQRVA